MQIIWTLVHQMHISALNFVTRCIFLQEVIDI